MLVVRKDSFKTATIGTELTEEDEEILVADPMLSINGIPETRISYNTLGEGEFMFDVDANADTNAENNSVELCEYKGCKASSGQYPSIMTGIVPIMSLMTETTTR